MPILFQILVFVAAALFVFGAASLFETRPEAKAFTVRRGGSQSGLVAFVGRLITPDENERRRRGLWLLQAGYDSPDSVQDYRAIRILLTAALPLAVIGILPVIKPDIPSRFLFVTAIAGAAAGMMAPALYVRMRRARLQREARNGLPDTLDLLLVCSEAGLGIDTAVMKVAEEMASIHPYIASCLGQISAELRAGRPRAAAFRSFADRTGIPETMALVNLLVQSDALGTSMSATLRAFSDDMRARRLLRAEELGQKVSVKLSIVLASCFLPALLTLICAPIIFRLLVMFGRAHG
jgi:tight adherence protein C